MIRLATPPKSDDGTESLKGFDDFDLRLGDVVRGERATKGKSLLDVQRELRIKAEYIAAIENCDASAFETPSFVSGYVRSYARYLGMNPEDVFAKFCEESGFSGSSSIGVPFQQTARKPSWDEPIAVAGKDPLADPRTPYMPAKQSIFSNVQPAAVGSTFVLMALIGGIGYGGWSVLQEIQRVNVDPVEQAPLVLSELDPLEGALETAEDGETRVAGVFTPPSADSFDRLYRPQALDVPVLTARDAPISTLDPNSVGLYAAAARTRMPQIEAPTSASLELASATTGAIPGLPGSLQPGVTIVAVRPAWVQITAADGGVLYSGIMNGGDRFSVPQAMEDARIAVGDSGSVYFAVNGGVLGPIGPRGVATSNIDLDAEALKARLTPSDIASDRDLGPVLSSLLGTPAPVMARAGEAPQDSGGPQVLAAAAPGVTLIAKREAWVRVRSASGTTLYETIMKPGDTWVVPQTEAAPILRTGNAGGIYFAVNGQTFGPFGQQGKVRDNLELGPQQIAQVVQPADLAQDSGLAKIVAQLTAR